MHIGQFRYKMITGTTPEITKDFLDVIALLEKAERTKGWVTAYDLYVTLITGFNMLSGVHNEDGSVGKQLHHMYAFVKDVIEDLKAGRRSFVIFEGRYFLPSSVYDLNKYKKIRIVSLEELMIGLKAA